MARAAPAQMGWHTIPEFYSTSLTTSVQYTSVSVTKWYHSVMRGITLSTCIHSMDSRTLLSSYLLLPIPLSMLIPAPTKPAGRQDPNLLQFISILLRPFQLTEMFIQRSFHYSLLNVAVNALELHVPVSI